MSEAPTSSTDAPGRARHAVALVVWLVICFAAPAVGAGAMSGGGGGWYAALAKPVWTPPAWVFGPVWTLLYVLMALGAWLVWLRPASRCRTVALSAFLLQLALNAAWTPIFFGAQRIGWAMVVLAMLWVALLVTVVLFWRVRALAGVSQLPYLLWVSYAATLNAGIWWLNT